MLLAKKTQTYKSSQLLLGSKHLTQQNLKLLAFGTEVQLGCCKSESMWKWDKWLILIHWLFHVFSLHMECHVGIHWSKCYSIFWKHQPPWRLLFWWVSSDHAGTGSWTHSCTAAMCPWQKNQASSVVWCESVWLFWKRSEAIHKNRLMHSDMLPKQSISMSGWG